MKRRLLAIFLVLALVLGFNTAALAENGDITIVSGDTTFTNGSVSVYNPEEDATYTSYYSYAQLPDDTNFSSVPVTIHFTGSSLKINGTTVDYSSPYEGSINFSGSSAKIEVVFAGGSKLYYASAYPSAFSATVVVNYENARTFSQLSPNAIYGTSGYLDPATTAQLANAASDVSNVDGYLPTVASRTLTTAVEAGDNPYDILMLLAAPLSLPVGGSSSYVSSIGALDMYSTATMYDYPSGGWMYKVQRGSETLFPNIGASGWKLMPGDVVTWIYTCDFGYDVGYPMW